MTEHVYQLKPITKKKNGLNTWAQPLTYVIGKEQIKPKIQQKKGNKDHGEKSLK